MIHPLLNSETSAHYDAQSIPSIYDLEKEMDLIEMLGWCKGNLFKYRRRLGRKATISHFVNDMHKKMHLHEVREKDLKKINTYEDYKAFLVDLGNRCKKETGTLCLTCAVRELIDVYRKDVVYGLEGR